MFGFKLQDLLGRSAYEKVHPEDVDGVRQQALEAIATQRATLRVEYRYLHARGEYVLVESIIRMLFDANGQFAGAIFSSRDITEKKRAEQALLESEERLRLALEAADQGLYDLNVQTGEAEVSPEYATMLGYDPAEFHETNAAWIERLHPEDHEPVAAVYRDYIAGKIPEYRVEFRQRTRSGEWKWILSLGRVVERDAQGQPLRMLGTHTDITERKRMEETLRESEERFRLLIQNSSDIIMVADENGSMRFVGGPSERILGYRASEMIGTSGFDLIHPEDRQRVVWVFEGGVKQPGIVGSSEYRYRHKDGHWVHLEAVGTNLLSDPRVKGIVVNIRDITERKRAEEALRASEVDYQEVFNASNDAIFIHEASNGAIVDVNQAMLQLYGYTHEEVLRLNIGDFSRGDPPYSQAEAGEWVRKAAESGPQLFEWMARGKTGRSFGSRSTLNPLSLESRTESWPWFATSRNGRKPSRSGKSSSFNSTSPRRWSRWGDWPAAWPTISTTCFQRSWVMPNWR